MLCDVIRHVSIFVMFETMIFTRILGNSPEQPPIRIITLFPCRGLVNPEHDPWKSRPKTPPSFAYPMKSSVCCEGFKRFKACPKRATRQFRSPIETACGANREAPWQSQQDASRAAAEGSAVLRPSKAAARVLRVLRPAQNVPCGSFEAQ